MNNDYTISENLVNFVRTSTQHFDESHGLDHALKVTHTTHAILHNLNEPYDKLFTSTIAMLHDVCDHKYPNSILIEELENFIIKHNGNDT